MSEEWYINSPNWRFVFLSSEDVAFLSEPSNSSSRRSYTDCLTLLRDVLVSYGSAPEHPVFPQEEAMQHLQETLHELASSLEGFWEQGESIVTNASINSEHAWLLRSMVTDPEYLNEAIDGVVGYRIRALIDNYLYDLLKQYGIIRRSYTVREGSP